MVRRGGEGQVRKLNYLIMKIVNLQEYIHPKMDILFVALNAPEISNSNAHWFSGTLNFWNILFDSGLIVERI